jgi:hypothetical protein
MIQRPKPNPRNEYTVVLCVQRSSRHKSSRCWHLLGQGWNFVCILPGKGCNYHNEVLQYVALLDKLNQPLVSKHQGKLSKQILFLQDTAAPPKAAIIYQKVADLNFLVLNHQAYSPDLAPSYYYIFPNLKKHIRRRKFSCTEQATLAVEGWFAVQPKEFFLDVKTTKTYMWEVLMGDMHVNTSFQSSSLFSL